MLENSEDRVEIQVDRRPRHALVFDAARCAPDEAAAWFDAPAASVTTDGGRGGVRWFDTRHGRAVARHYRRGGAIARFIADRYLYTGLARTRAYREFELLAHAHGLGLPVPRPLAARIERRGWTYRADLATRAIEGARTLASRVEEGALEGFDWRALGATIARFEAAGIRHADLNAHNVLVDAGGRFWLLDFDRGRIVRDVARDGRALARLERSLRKVGLARVVAHPDAEAFEPLRRGYAGVPA